MSVLTSTVFCDISWIAKGYSIGEMYIVKKAASSASSKLSLPFDSPIKATFPVFLTNFGVISTALVFPAASITKSEPLVVSFLTSFVVFCSLAFMTSSAPYFSANLSLYSSKSVAITRQPFSFAI